MHNIEPSVSDVGDSSLTDASNTEILSSSNVGNPNALVKMLAELYKKVLEEGVKDLRISGVGFPDGEKGWFSPNSLRIEIFREKGLGFVEFKNAKEFAIQCPNPLNELIILAHELGHYLSYKNDNKPNNYDSTVKKFNDISQRPFLSTDEKNIILEEENNAWNYAVRILKELSFTEWDKFTMACEESRKAYHQKFSSIKAP